MGHSNEIKKVIRRSIVDELQVGNYNYHGILNEPEFLDRVFGLKDLESKDSRCNNAYEEIYQHTVHYDDWSSNWVFTDPRFNLMYCEDQTFLTFLTETIHPAVQIGEDDVLAMKEIYNRKLEAAGYKIIQTKDINGKPVFQGKKMRDNGRLVAKQDEIKKYLDTDYVKDKINLMNEEISKNTDLAIGTAKELIETVCKSILQGKGRTSDPSWGLGKLVKETTNSLDLQPKQAANPAKAESSIKKILGGLGSIVQGIGELRNAYGTGHGKEANFKGLEPRYAKLIVGVASDLSSFYLSANDKTLELVE